MFQVGEFDAAGDEMPRFSCGLGRGQFDCGGGCVTRGFVAVGQGVGDELPGGGYHLRLRLSGLEEIERWILSWGTHANWWRRAIRAAGTSAQSGSWDFVTALALGAMTLLRAKRLWWVLPDLAPSFDRFAD